MAMSNPDGTGFVIADHAGTIEVEAGTTVHFDFSAEAAWEQAVGIFDKGGNMIADKGTYTPRRDLESWEMTFERDEILGIVGWHKEGGPSASKPWIQSLMRIITHSDGSITYGFEDSNDGDYNDIVATFSIIN
ncbi:hypothetical protein CN581_26900 [Bacillus toyonensis]|uniref:hypothetical protein n=1 Tax=Bacillus toyonensis TaxID=155322 RepID=UPI000BF34232|nr:hypothetical protein [Bacillus toyonensis]PEP75436.1 hypothetical protein CN581_26900 [Bacillus toyonensis]